MDTAVAPQHRSTTPTVTTSHGRFAAIGEERLQPTRTLPRLPGTSTVLTRRPRTGPSRDADGPSHHSGVITDCEIRPTDRRRAVITVSNG